MKYKRATLKLSAIIAGGFLAALVMQLCSQPDNTHDDIARAACARVVLDTTPGGVVWVDKARWPVARTGHQWRVKVGYETTHAGGIKTYHVRACDAQLQLSGRWRVELRP